MFEAAHAESRVFAEDSGSSRARDNVNFTRSARRASARTERVTETVRNRGTDEEQGNSDTVCFRCGLTTHAADDC